MGPRKQRKWIEENPTDDANVYESERKENSRDWGVECDSS